MTLVDFYNNIFTNALQGKGKTINGPNVYQNAGLPVFINGNVYVNGVNPYQTESDYLELNSSLVMIPWSRRMSRIAIHSNTDALAVVK